LENSTVKFGLNSHPISSSSFQVLILRQKIILRSEAKIVGN
jgi:hypothetical protein